MRTWRSELGQTLLASAQGRTALRRFVASGLGQRSHPEGVRVTVLGRSYRLRLLRIGARDR